MKAYLGLCVLGSLTISCAPALSPHQPSTPTPLQIYLGPCSLAGL